MKKSFLLSLSLASLLLAAGCCDPGTCYIASASADETIEAVPAESAPGPQVEDKATGDRASSTLPTQAESDAESSAALLPTTAAVTLPEGWRYLSESDLADGRVNTITYDHAEYYAHMTRGATR